MGWLFGALWGTWHILNVSSNKFGYKFLNVGECFDEMTQMKLFFGWETDS